MSSPSSAPRACDHCSKPALFFNGHQEKFCLKHREAEFKKMGKDHYLTKVPPLKYLTAEMSDPDPRFMFLGGSNSGI